MSLSVLFLIRAAIFEIFIGLRIHVSIIPVKTLRSLATYWPYRIVGLPHVIGYRDKKKKIKSRNRKNNLFTASHWQKKCWDRVEKSRKFAILTRLKTNTDLQNFLH